ncbi:MAG: T9SS type A sorting domain-containing protein [Flavobacterium sp.]|nr:T9SS type A sorting domain-containing protein [Flavobacterium sp.]
MKKIILITLFFNSFLNYAQSTIQSVNSGSLITATSSVSIGEIVVNPVNQNQSSSGLIGILSQVNQQLEVPQFELSENITVYPNPTATGITFHGKANLSNQKVIIFSTNGQLVTEKNIQSDNSVDLSNLSTGIYVIQLSSDQKKSFKIIKR